ncbi:MAG: hypothetical protein WCY09_00280 [Candidatus Omnitrophota bacterium]
MNDKEISIELLVTKILLVRGKKEAVDDMLHMSLQSKGLQCSQ